MDEKFINAVKRGVDDTFSQMLGWSVQNVAGKKISLDQAIQEEYCVVIGFAGNMQGLITLKCSKKVAVQAASGMLGTEISPDEADAIGEILNMITGAIKSHLAVIDDPFKVAPPTIVSGKDYKVFVKSKIDGDITLFKFEAEKIGSFYIEVYVTQNEDK